MKSTGSDQPRLWGIWGALTSAVLVGVFVLAGVLTLLWVGLGQPYVQTSRPLQPSDQLGLIRIALIVTGGLGGMVALVVAYRRQRLAESEAGRAVQSHNQENYRLFNDLYISTSQLLGHVSPAVRQAGVYGMARLADDWPADRQSCIDVLCAYLRTPVDAAQSSNPGEREVRLSIIYLISTHIDGRSEASWRGFRLDLDDVDFEGKAALDLVREMTPGKVVDGLLPGTMCAPYGGRRGSD
jgi:hypothetical protein